MVSNNQDDDFGDDGEGRSQGEPRKGIVATIDTEAFVSPTQLVTKCIAIMNREVDQLKNLAQNGILDASESRRLNEYLRTSVAIVKDLKLDQMQDLREQLKSAQPHEIAAAAITAAKLLGIDYEAANKTSPRAAAATPNKKE